MRTYLCVFLAACMAAAGVAACGGDDNGTPVDGGSDGGAETGPPVDSGLRPVDSGRDSGSDSAPPPDTGTTDTGVRDTGVGDTGMPEGGDGGPCDFGTLVLGLIANDTTNMATPAPCSQPLCGCTDMMSQAQYQSLFP